MAITTPPRRHLIPAPLAAACLLGSMLFAVTNIKPTYQSLLRGAVEMTPATPESIEEPRRQLSISTFLDPKSTMVRSDAPILGDSASSGNMPNVIYLQHESLSGAIMLNTDEGVAATPFFNKMKNENDDFYVFEHGRTVSGITIDAFPALMSGCAPYTQDSVKWLHEKGRPIGYNFKSRGYNTASFSSRALDDDMKKGHWSMLYDVIVGGMDYVVDPLKMKWKLENAEGSDDRKMLPLIEEWIKGLESGKPFYAQMYNFNQHYPHVKDKSKPGFSHRYFDSLATTDEFLETLFDILARTGHLENTIVVGSGDHGEDPFKAKYVRLKALDSNILHAAHYIYYPKHLMPNQASADIMRKNTQQMTHTLDMHPTVSSILNGGYYDPLEVVPKGCITGVDLTSVPIPNDRVVISWNHVSAYTMKKLPAQFWALSTRDSSGKDWSLYHRYAKKSYKEINQGKNDWYVLEYGECTRNTKDSKNYCSSDKLSKSQTELFQRAVEWVKHTPMLKEGIGDSKLVKKFVDKVKWKETGEYDVMA